MDCRVSIKTPESFLVKRLHPEAVLPKKDDLDNLGFDIFWSTVGDVEQKEFVGMTQWVIPTGLSIAVPSTWGVEIRDRSGWAREYGAHVVGGVIDAGYRGEYMVMVQFPHRLIAEAGGNLELNSRLQPFRYDLRPGAKIAQLLLRPNPGAEVEEVGDLPPSKRGTKGFGSSDRGAEETNT